MKALAQFIRVVTVAPFMALMLFTLLYRKDPSEMTDFAHYLWSVFFYTLLPLLAYPVSWLLPKIRKGGRSAQRKLAILFSVAGYIGGVIYLALWGGTGAEWLVYLTYAGSGSVIALFTFLFRFKASGHTCGVSGPVAMLVHLLGAPWLALYLLVAAVVWASLRLERHTVSQLLVGSAVPVCVMLLLTRLPV